jgi:hypothetical protein
VHAPLQVGPGIRAFQVRSHPEHDSRCFFVIRTDGTAEDFSYRKCAEALVPAPDAEEQLSNLRRGVRSEAKRGRGASVTPGRASGGRGARSFGDGGGGGRGGGGGSFGGGGGGGSFGSGGSKRGGGGPATRRSGGSFGGGEPAAGEGQGAGRGGGRGGRGGGARGGGARGGRGGRRGRGRGRGRR